MFKLLFLIYFIFIVIHKILSLENEKDQNKAKNITVQDYLPINTQLKIEKRNVKKVKAKTYSNIRENYSEQKNLSGKIQEKTQINIKQLKAAQQLIEKQPLKNNVRQGIIWSVIIGAPRAKVKFSRHRYS
ncbi:MAG: hypothetical protein DRP78_04590 [Candidatus Omnitrophota bacterium]|nr:MAG: hypothetical protein DRP78_04590 [Candidatus Omnitrophota bacterium]